MDWPTEFDRQLDNLIKLGYPKLAKMGVSDFSKLATPLLSHLSQLTKSEFTLSNGVVPFVLVVSSQLINAKQQMEALSWKNKPGFEKLYPHQADEFTPIKSVALPTAPIYLLINIDRGDEFLNIRPEDALKTIGSREQTPLTMEEGIALVTQFPDILIKNHCFSLLGSRVEGNQRVPAIWINAQKQANLGWCWDRNPHTWLGSAFANKRVG